MAQPTRQVVAAAFFSYSHRDDEDGMLEDLARRLQDEVHRELGHNSFVVNIDKEIPWGGNWRRWISEKLAASAFLVPVITPSYFTSEGCRAELDSFTNTRICPIYWRTSPTYETESDQAAQRLKACQHRDLREYRFQPKSPESLRQIAEMAHQIALSLERFKGQSVGDARHVVAATTSAPEDVWTAVTRVLRAQVSEAVWFSTFQDARVLDSPDDRLRIKASKHAADRIESRYLPLVQDALKEIGHGHRRLVVEHDEQADSGHNDASGFAVDTDERRDRGAGSSNNRLQGRPNPSYTFETFVKGASNQFALAAALRVAETPGRSYNPLFIYGWAGLGKTHLLHAIGNYVVRHYPHDVVRYVTTETFLNEYVDAIRTSTTANFKRRYRDIDVLLIDDIQFMEGKEGLQEEFFHTFNSLHGANKQIVISSDRMPDAIPTLETRLRARFKWGLITDMQPPDLETRLAILRNKAERDHSLVPSEVLELIASRVTSNIRELEGALIRVTAYASLNQVPISTHMAENLLHDVFSDNTRS